ncbi:MAG: phage portal protein [Planctomycetes bacterium]|nr:phage portal protein [Planctomycetota bacterium]
MRNQLRTRDGRKAVPEPIYGGVVGRIRRAFDGFVDTFAPGTAHKMRKSRLCSAAMLAYEAARVDRMQPRQTSGSADSEILPSLENMRSATRNMVRDDAHAAAGVRVYEENVVGKGLVPQATCTPEATGMTEAQCQQWNRDLEAEFARWSEDVADATGHGSFYDLQRIAAHAMLPDGELIGHAVLDGDEVRCELIDPDRLESPRFTDTLTLRGGVEIGTSGQPIAYHILRVHPSEVHLGGSVRDFMRIPARDGRLSVVQHVFRRDRPGQTRGVPWLAPSVQYTGHLHHYLNSELVAARTNSNTALYIKRTPDPNDPNILPVEPMNGGVENYLESLAAGTIEYLNEGEEPFAFNPQRPGSQFDPFVTRILRAIWAAPGLAYEIVTRDFAKLNYSSARSLLLECRRSFELSRMVIVRLFCRPWWHNVAHVAVANGRLSPPRQFFEDPRPFLAARWVPPAYGWVDPVKEITASQQAVEGNLSTPYDEASRAGLDAEAVVDAKARFLVYCRSVEEKNDLPPGSLTATANSASPPPAAAPAEEPADDEGADNEDPNDDAPDGEPAPEDQSQEEEAATA